MRIAMCGWESGSVDEAGVASLHSTTGTQSIQSNGRSGSYALRLGISNSAANNVAYAQRIVTLPGAPSEVYIRIAQANLSYGRVSDTMIVSLLDLLDGATVHLAFGVLRTAGPCGIIVFRGTTQIVTGGVFSGGANWALIEIHAIIDDTNGVVQVWVDGALVIDFAGDTRNASAARITNVAIGPRRANAPAVSTNTADSCDFDDFAVNDTNGSLNTGRIGQGGIFPLRPNLDTAQKDLTPFTGGDNYAMVDEAQLDGDTTYVTGVNSGQRDLYEFTNLSGGSQIDAVTVVGGFRASGGAGAPLAPTVRSGAVTENGSSWFSTNTYTLGTTLWEADPATDAPWTLVAVNSLQAGVTIL